MFPSALSRNYEDINDKYTVRVENLNYECDLRVFLSTLKAKYVQIIQICDNPDVMKGSRSLGGVIDINMVRGAKVNDIFVGMEMDTKGLKHAPVANAVYGNGKTDVLVSASIEDSTVHRFSTTVCSTTLEQHFRWLPTMSITTTAQSFQTPCTHLTTALANSGKCTLWNFGHQLPKVSNYALDGNWTTPTLTSTLLDPNPSTCYPATFTHH